MRPLQPEINIGKNIFYQGGFSWWQEASLCWLIVLEQGALVLYCSLLFSPFAHIYISKCSTE